MATEYAVQRLELGDVVLIDLPEQGEEVEATVVRAIDRTDRTVRVRCTWKDATSLSGSGPSARWLRLSAAPDRPAC
jgi:hypothetical protein